MCFNAVLPVVRHARTHAPRFLRLGRGLESECGPVARGALHKVTKGLSKQNRTGLLLGQSHGMSSHFDLQTYLEIVNLAPRFKMLMEPRGVTPVHRSHDMETPATQVKMALVAPLTAKSPPNHLVE